MRKLIDDFNNSSAWLEFFIRARRFAAGLRLRALLGRHLKHKGVPPRSGLARNPLHGHVPLDGVAVDLHRASYHGAVHAGAAGCGSLLLLVLVDRDPLRGPGVEQVVPPTTGMRLIERASRGWSGLAVLYSPGPAVAGAGEELDAVRLTLGKSQISLLLSLIDRARCPPA